MDAQAAAAQFPPGYLESYNGHPLFATCVSCIVLDIFFVFVRFLSRWMHNTPKGWDDFLMVPGLIFSVLLAAQGLIGINYCGVGHHVEAIELSDPSQLISLYKLLIFFPATYAIAVTFPKLSILAMYLRIFTVPFYRMVTYTVIYIIVISSTILFMMMLFQCTPVNYFWDKTIPGGECHLNIEKLFLYASLPNIISDILMLMLPLPFVFRLNMTKKMKVGLGITLLTGSSGLATSILRFVAFKRQSLFPDTPRAASNLALYTVLETSMYLIAACLPACRPLFNILRHPSRNMQKNEDQKYPPNSPSVNTRNVNDDIELQRANDGGGRSENWNWIRYHGFGEGFRGMQGRFKRLGSDAGFILGRSRETSPHFPPAQSQSQSQSRSSHASPPQQERDPDRQFTDQAEGRLGLGLHKLRSGSRERIFKHSFRTPDRVHIADMHMGHVQQSEDPESPESPEGKGGFARDGIRIKQEFDVYYDRPAL